MTFTLRARGFKNTRRGIRREGVLSLGSYIFCMGSRVDERSVGWLRRAPSAGPPSTCLYRGPAPPAAPSPVARAGATRTRTTRQSSAPQAQAQAQPPNHHQHQRAVGLPVAEGSEARCLLGRFESQRLHQSGGPDFFPVRSVWTLTHTPVYTIFARVVSSCTQLAWDAL